MAEAGMNGHAPAYVEPEIAVPPAVLTALAEQVAALQDQTKALTAHLPEAAATARSLLLMQDRIARIEQFLAQMQAQQTAQHRQLDMNARATALDLALKALGPASENGAAAMGLAEGFLAWLTGATPAAPSPSQVN